MLSLLLLLQFSCNSDDETPSPSNDTITITEDINSPTTWTKQTNNANDFDYKISSNIDVDAVLTIEPGVKIGFESGVLMNIDDGALVAVGTASERIVFTGCESIKGFWNGIRFRSDDVRNEMDFCEVSFAGHPDFGANIGVDDFAGVEARFKITNSVVSNSANVGIWVEDEAELTEFSNNTFSDNDGTPLVTSANSVHQIDAASDFSDNNGFNGVTILGSTLTVNQEVSWTKLSNSSPYFVSGDFKVETGLIISAGCEFIMEPSIKFVVEEEGYLIAEGTATDNIVFDGVVTDQPSWLGLLFRTDDPRNILDFCRINAGGSNEITGDNTANIAVDDFAGVATKITIQNCEITGSGGCGIYVDQDAELTHSNNVFANNVSDDICL